MTQHRVIAESRKRLFEQLDAIATGVMLTRESVESPGRTYKLAPSGLSAGGQMVRKLLRDNQWERIDPEIRGKLQRTVDALWRRCYGQVPDRAKEYP